MSQYPEKQLYTFIYSGGSPVSFANLEIWAQLRGGTGAKILVQNSMNTDGNGILFRVPPQPSWLNPELRLIDEAANESETFPLFAWPYKLKWDRPASYAEFDGVAFAKPGDFLDYLVTRYGFLSNMQPPNDFKVNRVGSPAPEPPSSNMFNSLAFSMGSAGQANGGQIRKHAASRMCEEVAKVVPIADRSDQKKAFLQALKGMVELERNGNTKALVNIFLGLQRALISGTPFNEVISITEDWVIAGLLVYLAGLIPFGYELGNLQVQPAFSNIWTASMSAKTKP